MERDYIPRNGFGAPPPQTKKMSCTKYADRILSRTFKAEGQESQKKPSREAARTRRMPLGINIGISGVSFYELPASTHILTHEH